MLNFRRVSLDGLGGTTFVFEDEDAIFLADGVSGGLEEATLFVKKESRRARSPSPFVVGLSLPAMPMRICASLLDNWFGLSRRWARWVAALAVGEGGRGEGFIACATGRGIVGMLLDDTTGSRMVHKNQATGVRKRILLEKSLLIVAFINAFIHSLMTSCSSWLK